MTETVDQIVLTLEEWDELLESTLDDETAEIPKTAVSNAEGIEEVLREGSLAIGVTRFSESGSKHTSLLVGRNGVVVAEPDADDCGSLSVSLRNAEVDDLARLLLKATGLGEHLAQPEGEVVVVPDDLASEFQLTHVDVAYTYWEEIGGGSLTWIDHGPGYAPGVIVDNAVDLGDGADPVIEVWHAVDVLAELVSYLPPLEEEAEAADVG